MTLICNRGDFSRQSLARELPCEAHVWLAHSHAAVSRARRERYESLLSAEEHARYRRFYFERDRLLYLVAHALVRTTLSRYADVAPDRWVFRSNRFGRPEIDIGACTPPVRFNLSHTHGLVACLVTKSMDCGVDVEHERPVEDLMGLARSVFSRRELKALQALPSARRASRFFDYWTLKESYIKARGMGLSLPLKEFSFCFDGNRLTGIEIAAVLEDDPAEWQFSLGEPSEARKLAVAVRRGAAPDLRVVCRFTEP